MEDRVLRRAGSADEIALADVAADAGQQIECGAILDPFGHDAQSQRVAEIDSRPDQLTSLLCGGQAGDKRAVELDLADCEAAEVGQGSESCAEVVDRYSQTQISQLGDDTLASLELSEDGCLRNLQYQRARRKTVVREARPNQLDEAAIEQVCG